MNLATLDSNTRAILDEVRADIHAIRERAADDGRPETAEERARVDALLRKGEDAKTRLDRARSDDAVGTAIDRLTSTGPADAMLVRTGATLVRPASGPVQWPGRVASIGDQFVCSATYQHVQRTSGQRGQHWQSPSSELVDPRAMYAATVTGDPASGGTLVVPDYQPGVIPTPLRRLVVTDLIAPGTTDSNLVTYMVEKSFVIAADTVLEGAAKPESTLTFDAVSDPVRKIAHWLPVSDEMLEDVAYMRSYINARLTLGVQLTEDDQVLNGSLVAPDIIGIRNRVGLAAEVTKGATESTADAIWRQITAIATTSTVPPDGIVMNHVDAAAIPTMKNTAGDYIEGAGPFQRPGPLMLWGLPVAVTSAMPVGVALVGAFRSQAQIFRRGGIRVEASNSHQDFFTRNLVAIRAEERLALAVYMPSAFGEVILG